MVGATLNHKLRVAHGNVRKFLAAATEGVELGAYAGVVQQIYAAVEDIEAKTGAPLDASNDKGWKALQKRVEVRASPRARQRHCKAGRWARLLSAVGMCVQAIQKEHGLDDYAKVKKESILEMVRCLPSALLALAHRTGRRRTLPLLDGLLHSQQCRSEACGAVQYKTQLDKIKEQAMDKMEQAKRRDGLDFIQVDLSSLRPKLD